MEIIVEKVDSLRLRKSLGEPQYHFCMNMFSQLQNVSEQRIAETVSHRRTFRTTATSLENRLLRIQLGSGGKTKSATRIVPTKSAKRSSQSRSEIFTKSSHFSCQTVFCTNLSRQLLEILEKKDPVVELVLSSQETESFLLPHWIETIKFFSLKLFGTVTLI